MERKAITKSEVIERLALKHGLDKKEAAERVDFILGEIMEALAYHEHVEIRGFGTFDVRVAKPRRSRNPKTGENLLTDYRIKVRYRMGKKMFNEVNKNQGESNGK